MKTRIQISLLAGVALTLLVGGCGSVVDADAEKTMLGKLGNTTITVYPAYLRMSNGADYSEAAAKQIAEFFDQRHLATVSIANDQVPIGGEWKMNQSKMLRESIAAFQSYLRDHPPQTDYAFLAEYLLVTGEHSGVIGVHGYLLDREGRVACAVGVNSHHDSFNEVNPKTVDDCTLVLLKSIAPDLGTTAP